MDTTNQQTIESICDYAARVQLKDMLHTYMKRVIVNKPNDPIQFLIDTITNDPFLPVVESEDN